MTTLDPNYPSCELVSALVDGELEGSALAPVLKAWGTAPARMDAAWCEYHLIGDALRQGAPMVASLSGDVFLTRFQQRLAADEPPGTAPSEVPGLVDAGSRAFGSLDVTSLPTAANDETFRWKLLAGFASLAAVLAITWTVVSPLGAAPGPQLASVDLPVAPVPESQVVVPSPLGPMVRDARLEELLAAHRQLGSANALQAPSGFFRSAGFEKQQGGRQ
jgi:sigma-E factor negative regulatory protein RseA